MPVWWHKRNFFRIRSFPHQKPSDSRPGLSHVQVLDNASCLQQQAIFRFMLFFMRAPKLPGHKTFDKIIHYTTRKSFLFFTVWWCCVPVRFFSLLCYLPLPCFNGFSGRPKIIYCKYLINTKNNQLSNVNTLHLPYCLWPYLYCIELKPDGVIVGSSNVVRNDY